MKRHDGEDDPAASGGSSPEPADDASAPDAGDAPGQETGLEGVDAQPLAPLTREQVEGLRRERDELADQLLRKRAEFDNFRKRMEREKQQASTEALAAFFKDLVPTLDNIDRAVDSAADASSLREGLELIRRDLMSLLEAKGVAAEDPTGAAFDPTRHQALVHEPTPGVPEGTVVEVYRRGYSFRDRLLRPALVKVAKSEVPTQEPQTEPEKVH